MKQKFCTKCGHPLTEGQKFCSNCGEPVGVSAFGLVEESEDEEVLEEVETQEEANRVTEESSKVEKHKDEEASASVPIQPTKIETKEVKAEPKQNRPKKENVKKPKENKLAKISDRTFNGIKLSVLILRFIVLGIVCLTTICALFDFNFSTLVFMFSNLRHAIYDSITTNNFFIVPVILSAVSLLCLIPSIIFNKYAIVPFFLATVGLITTIVAGHFLYIPFSIPSIVLTFVGFVFLPVNLVYLIDWIIYLVIKKAKDKQNKLA